MTIVFSHNYYFVLSDYRWVDWCKEPLVLAANEQKKEIDMNNLFIFHNKLSYPQARSAIPCFIEHSVQLF